MTQFETVGDILENMGGETHQPPKPAEPFALAVLQGTPELPAPGIYFGMPEEDYHALPALSASGIKDLAASPMLFWAKCTWLSERRRKEEAERANKPEERAHRTIGRAYHCRILEGPEAYAERFACELSAEQCGGALESTDQIKGAIRAFEHKPISKVPDELPNGQAYERSAVKEDWIEQLLAIDPKAKVLSRLRQQHRDANAGKAFISFEAHEQIEIAARMVEADETIRHAVQGGYPEVTLIWHCAETGVPMKARCDRLKLKAIVDLKSIGNERGRTLRNAIRGAISSYHYNIQPSVYIEGAQAVKRLVASGAFAGSDIPRDYRDWCNKWAAVEDEPEWWWLFQQKGIAPVTRLVRYLKGLATRTITDDIIRTQKRRLREYSEQFGTSPWIDSEPPYDIADEDLFNSVTEDLR